MSRARLGGDEFAIQCRRGRSEGIGDLTERVEAALAGPIRLGHLSPDEFIPVAEESGRIIPLSDWMTREALARAKDWNLRFGLGLVMSTNVSPV